MVEIKKTECNSTCLYYRNPGSGDYCIYSPTLLMHIYKLIGAHRLFETLNI